MNEGDWILVLGRKQGYGFLSLSFFLYYCTVRMFFEQYCTAHQHSMTYVMVHNF